jgi:hypothetical protein
MEIQVSDSIVELNALIKSELWYDFYVASFDGRSMVLKGSLDTSYGHNLEIYLKQVSYVDAPIEWKIDTDEPIVAQIFSREDLEEYQRERYLDTTDGIVLGFKAECFDSKQWFYFVVQSFSFLHKGKWDSWKWYDGPNPPPIAGINRG